MSNKEVTAIIMYWYPYVGATQPIYKSIFEHLLNSGYRINLIAGIPHYRKGRKELWNEYKDVYYKRSFEGGIDITRVFVFSPRCNFDFDKNGIIRRFLNYFSFFISACWVLMFKTKTSPSFFFIPTFPPVFSGLLGVIALTLKKRPFVYNVQDVYPDMLSSLKLLKFTPLFAFLDLMERFVLKKARHIIVISNRMRQTLCKKGIAEDKISVIPNFCDTKFIKPLPKVNPFSQRYNLSDKFVVLYAGNMGPPQGMEFIIKAAGIIGAENKNIYFAFVGRGEKKKEIQELVKKMGLKNIIFVPLQPFENMPYIWASADIALVSLRKDLSHLAFPSKIYSIMSSGRSLIAMADEGSEIWEFVKNSQGGICVQSEDYKSLADTIKYLYKNKSLRKNMGNKGRNFIEKNYSEDLVLQKYKKLFYSLTKEE